MVNMDVGGKNVTLKATHNNEKIYFNERELNDLVFQTEDPTITPFDQLIGVAQDYSLNWVRYSETLFPSTRNEFSSGSRERLGFDNGFWRDSRSERTIIGSNDAGDDLGYNSFGIPVSQSSWILDAPQNFLTRENLLTGALESTPSVILDLPHLSGTAGELQNEYLYCFANSSISAGATTVLKTTAYKASAIMSRKQFLTSPRS